MQNPMKTEPALFVSVIAALALLFGVKISTEDANARLRVLVFAAPLLGGIAIRQQVSPVHKVEEAATQAYRDIEVGG